MSKNRNYQITINNPQEHDINHDAIIDFLDDNNVKFACGVDEIGLETNTYHTHLFVVFQNARYLKSVIKMFSCFNGAHVEFCRGSLEENIDYIKKENKHEDKKETQVENSYFEYGEMPSVTNSNSSNDKEEMIKLINNGYSVDEIVSIYPKYFFQYDKIKERCDAVKTKLFRSKRRTELEVTYIYGDAGAGKTRYIYDNYDDVYRTTNYEHPFDDYEHQSILVLDEYRSNFPIEYLLNILDIYPLNLACRFHNKVACFTKVFIISNAPLDEQYEHEKAHTKKALYRRIHKVIKMTHKETVYYEDLDLYFKGICSKVESKVK